MRHAPPARVTCTGGGAWRAAHVLLCMLAAAVAAAWAALLTTAGAAAVPASMAAVLAAGAAGAAAWRATQPVSTALVWDGERWSANGEPGTADVMLDLGTWLLLRFSPEAGSRRSLWLPVARASQALRAALYAHRSSVSAEPRGG